MIERYIATKKMSADFKFIVETVWVIFSNSNAIKTETDNKN